MKKPKMHGQIKNRLPINMLNYHFRFIRNKAMLSMKEVAENVGFSQHSLMRIETCKKRTLVPIHFVFSLIQKIEQTYGHERWAYFIKWFNDKYPGYEFYPDYGITIDEIKRPVVKPAAPANEVKTISGSAESGKVASN